MELSILLTTDYIFKKMCNELVDKKYIDASTDDNYILKGLLQAIEAEPEHSSYWYYLFFCKNDGYMCEGDFVDELSFTQAIKYANESDKQKFANEYIIYKFFGYFKNFRKTFRSFFEYNNVYDMWKICTYLLDDLLFEDEEFSLEDTKTFFEALESFCFNDLVEDIVYKPEIFYYKQLLLNFLYIKTKNENFKSLIEKINDYFSKIYYEKFKCNIFVYNIVSSYDDLKYNRDLYLIKYFEEIDINVKLAGKSRGLDKINSIRYLLNKKDFKKALSDANYNYINPLCDFYKVELNFLKVLIENNISCESEILYSSDLKWIDILKQFKEQIIKVNPINLYSDRFLFQLNYYINRLEGKKSAIDKYNKLKYNFYEEIERSLNGRDYQINKKIINDFESLVNEYIQEDDIINYKNANVYKEVLDILMVYQRYKKAYDCINEEIKENLRFTYKGTLRDYFVLKETKQLISWFRDYDNQNILINYECEEKYAKDYFVWFDLKHIKRNFKFKLINISKSTKDVKLIKYNENDSDLIIPERYYENIKNQFFQKDIILEKNCISSSNLRTITFPLFKELVLKENSIFNCKNLEKIIVSNLNFNGNKLFNAIKGCNENLQIYFRNYDESMSYLILKNSGFYFNSDKIVLDTSEIIKAYIFQDMKIIVNNFFKDYQNLKEIVYVNNPNLFMIEKNAFNNCLSLEKFISCDSLKIICNEAFKNCESLKEIFIGKNVKLIDKNPFLGCKNILKINVDSENIIYDSREDCNAIIDTATNTLLIGCNNTIVPKSIKKINLNTLSENANQIKFAGNIYDWQVVEFDDKSYLSNFTIYVKDENDNFVNI